MSNRLFIVVLAGVLLAASCWAAFAERAREERSGPPPPPAAAGDELPGLGPAGKNPEMFGLVRDISILRQINRADLSADQIRRILPLLKELAKEQDKVVGRVKESLQGERERLLRQQGPEKSKPDRRAGEVTAIRSQSEAYRQKVAATKVELRKILNPQQADIIGRLITPPQPPRGFPGARLVNPPDRGPSGPRATAPAEPRDRPGRGPTIRGGMRGGPGPTADGSSDLNRVIQLLEEKLAAMKGK